MRIDIFAPKPPPHCPRLSLRSDKLNDHTSLDRALSQRLVLLVREKGSDAWTFPRTVRKEGEQMVEAAKRGLSACYGPKLGMLLFTILVICVSVYIISLCVRVRYLCA